MLFVFGTVLKRICLDYHQAPKGDGLFFPEGYESEPGGHGALQALAASRSCIKVALISCTGDGYEAGYFLPKIRIEGISTSGVTRSENAATGVTIETYENGILKNIQTALSACAQTSHEQIPDEFLNERSIVLLQTELPPEQNSALLARARAKGATTILHFSPRPEIPAADYAAVDFLITGEKDALALRGKPAKAIVILHDNFDATLLPSDPPLRIEAPRLPVVDKSGSADAFCGTFAAGLFEKLSPEKAMLRACAAAALSATKNGAYAAMPFGADIEAALKA